DLQREHERLAPDVVREEGLVLAEAPRVGRHPEVRIVRERQHGGQEHGRQQERGGGRDGHKACDARDAIAHARREPHAIALTSRSRPTSATTSARITIAITRSTTDAALATPEAKRGRTR